MHSTPIAVFGSGSWGTALALVLAQNGQDVHLWGRSEEHMRLMQKERRNQKYLPDISFPDNLILHSTIEEALATCSDILIAVPSHAFAACLTSLKPHLNKDARIVWATKGLDPKQGEILPFIAQAILGDAYPLAILSGPSFASEVAAQQPTAVTIATEDKTFGEDLQSRFHNHYFRVYLNDDMIGVSVCGAVKNVLAIAVGVCDGMGFGANAKAALITRGLAEMTRLGLALGANLQTFLGLAGVGDVMLTCTDDQSRNRRFGLALAAGHSKEGAVKAIGQVVEGIGNAAAVLTLAEKNEVEMPIVEQVVRLVSDKASVEQTVETLLSRPAVNEFS